MLQILVFVIMLFSIKINGAWQKPIFTKPVMVCSEELFDKFNVAGLLRNEKNHDYYANVAGTVDFISQQQRQKISKVDLIIGIDRALAETIRNKAQHLVYHTYVIRLYLPISFDTWKNQNLRLSKHYLS